VNQAVAPRYEQVAKKAMTRLLPIIGITCFMSYVDRANLALAKTAVAADVGIGAAAYGLGAGLFFLSYALLEIPSNLALHRVGPRVWITRITVTWGAVSAAMMFVQNETSVNTVGVAGSFVGPLVYGRIEEATGSLFAPYYAIVAAACAGLALVGLLAALMRREQAAETRPVPETVGSRA
jgi:MFS family permease